MILPNQLEGDVKSLTLLYEKRRGRKPRGFSLVGGRGGAVTGPRNWSHTVAVTLPRIGNKVNQSAVIRTGSVSEVLLYDYSHKSIFLFFFYYILLFFSDYLNLSISP